MVFLHCLCGQRAVVSFNGKHFFQLDPHSPGSSGSHLQADGLPLDHSGNSGSGKAGIFGYLRPAQFLFFQVGSKIYFGGGAFRVFRWSTRKSFNLICPIAG